MRRAFEGRWFAIVAFRVALPAFARAAEADFRLTEVRRGVFAAIAEPGRDAATGNAGNNVAQIETELTGRTESPPATNP